MDILRRDLESAECDLLESTTAEELRPLKPLFTEFHHHAVSHFGVADTRRPVERISGFGFRSFSVDDHNYLSYRAR